MVETVGVEEASVVEIRLTPRSNANRTIVTASSHVVVGNDPLTIHWTADVPVNDGYSAVQAKVVRP